MPADCGKNNWERYLKAKAAPTTATYNALINACARTGDVKMAEVWLTRMLKSGVEPNTTTFNAVIATCAKAGDGHRVSECLEKMKAAGISPNSFSYNSIAIPRIDRSEGRFPLTDLKIGQELQGTIVSVAPFGVFCDVGADRDGLIHISEVSGSFVENIGDYAQPGKGVKVRVLNCDATRRRLSLPRRVPGPRRQRRPCSRQCGGGSGHPPRVRRWQRRDRTRARLSRCGGWPAGLFALQHTEPAPEE